MWESGTGTFLFTDFLGNLDRLNTSRFAPHIRRKARGYFSCTKTLLILLQFETLSLLQSLLLPASYTLHCDTFEIGVSNERTIPLPETPYSYEVQNGSVRAGMAETQDLSYLPFSQNPKQGLVTSNFRRD